MDGNCWFILQLIVVSQEKSFTVLEASRRWFVWAVISMVLKLVYGARLDTGDLQRSFHKIVFNKAECCVLDAYSGSARGWFVVLKGCFSIVYELF